MSDLFSGKSSLLEWAAAGRPFPGEHVSGDGFVVAEHPDGVLVSAIDGLGHGAEAARATRSAVEVLKKNPYEPLVSLVNRCHTALRQTRGVVMSLASFHCHDNQMEWLGIGNVETFLYRARQRIEREREALMLRGGIVGYRLPRLQPTCLKVEPGDLLILVTDGIQYRFQEDIQQALKPSKLARQILDQHKRETDDALVLVARYLGDME